jgi:hypothetical protein
MSVTLAAPAHGADWRWQIGRADTPWYPSMRLYRQVEKANWREVVERVTRDLKDWGSVR